MLNSFSAASSASNSVSTQDVEKQLWEIVKSIPGLNVTYGTVRCIVYVIKKDNKESVDSAIAVAKGAAQTAVITTGVVTAPVTIPVVAGGALTGIAAKSVSDTVEIIVFFVTNSEQLQGKKVDERGRIFYDRIKNVTGVGALYSAVRVPVYLIKKNKQQSVESSVGFVTNSGDTAVQIGVGLIPNVDEQLRKLIEKTARYAIKYLAKTVVEQTSRERVPLDQGLHTLAKVETDCQAIIEATTGQIEEPLEIENVEQTKKTGPPPSGQETTNEKQRKRTFFSCCWSRRKSNAKIKVQPTVSHPGKVPEMRLTENENHGHLIILTE